MKTTDTLIVGASFSGLACAACLRHCKIGYHIIEKHDRIAAAWHSHYERLHLHTPKTGSWLPYKKFARNIPRYPSRLQVIDYLEDYQKTFNIEPEFNTEALTIKREGEIWITQTTKGVYSSRNLIMATGTYSKPQSLDFPGLDTFPGSAIHSSQYRTGKAYEGKKVLVVGFGNSACEIAIDLYEQGAFPTMAVRSPVNIVPRELLGIPILQLSYLLNALPPHIADRLSKPAIQWALGDIEPLGLQYPPYGALEKIRRELRPPVLDIGTIRHIRKGHIGIQKDIDHIDRNTIYFKDGARENFDAIVAGIGFLHDYADILQVDKSRFDDLNRPTRRQRHFGEQGLYFCGYWISPIGQIREIAGDAKRIAAHIKANPTIQADSGGTKAHDRS